MSTYNDYENYYRIQAGGGMNYFSGPRYQKGYGLGSIFSGLLRAAMPLMKTGAKKLGKVALKTGTKIASDILKGDKFTDSLKRRTGDAVGLFAKRLNNPPPREKSISSALPTLRTGRKRAKKRKKSRSLDIFD